MNFRAAYRILFNRQFLPLTPHVQQFQDVVEQGVQGQLRRRAPASNGQVRQDKLPELIQAQFRRMPRDCAPFAILTPKRKGTCIESGDGAKTQQLQNLTGGSDLSGNPQTVV
jgi:hypothetical protein